LARALNVVLVLALLAATAVAFVIAEGAKLQRSPLAKTAVSKVFSPDATITRIVTDGKVTRYGHKVASIKFQLRSAQTLEIWIEDEHGDQVASLLPSRHFRKGQIVDVVWDGTEPNGLAAPDGVYRPVVKLPHRTIVLPNPIRLDTKPPVISVPDRPHVVISPDGDGNNDSFSVPYRVTEPAHAILRVRPAAAEHAQQVEYTYFQRLTGTLTWNGKFGGKAAKPGNYVLYASAQDTAGNRSKGKPFAVVQVRYLVLARTRVTVKPGGIFYLRVSTDAPNVRWSLHGRSGVEKRGTLHFHAPKSPGVYHLYVQAAGHAAQCTVVVA
jgi:hypothetical protein